MKTLMLVVIGLALCASGCGGSNATAQTGFSNSSLKGNYGLSFSASVLPTGHIAGTGVFMADGKGNITGVETVNVDGSVCSATLTGTYTINSDGTGTDTLEFTPTTEGCAAATFQQSLVLVDSGNVVKVSTDSSTEVTIFEEWRKQDG